MPLRCLARDDVLELLEGDLAPVATDLDIGRRNRDEDDDVVDRCRSLGERLGEGELGVEVSACQPLALIAVAQLPCVGDPFVDEDDRRAVLLEQRLKSRTGVRAVLVVGPNGLVAFLTAELVGEVAPQSVQFDALLDALRRRR